MSILTILGFAKALWPFIAAAGGLIAFFVWGQKKKHEGVQEEKARTKAVVDQVQAEMDSKLVKSPTTQETIDRLNEGNF